MHAVRDDTPNAELVICGYFNLLKILVVWYEPRTLVLGVELILFDCKFAVNAGSYIIAVLCFQRAVYYHDVAIVYACFHHTVARNAGVEGAFRVSHHLTSEVDGLSRMVLRWAGEASMQTISNLQFDAHVVGGGYVS